MAVHEHKTPFIKNDQSNLEVNNDAFQAALELIIAAGGEVTGVYEPFAGIGSQTKRVQVVWPGIRHIAVEIDLDTYNELAKNAAGLGVELHHCDAEEIAKPYLARELGPEPLLVLDFNWTLNPEKVQENLPWIWRGAEWVIMTDLASRFLHFHWESYGMEDRFWPAYTRRLEAVTGLQYVGVARTKRSLGYTVFRRRG